MVVEEDVDYGYHKPHRGSRDSSTVSSLTSSSQPSRRAFSITTQDEDIASKIRELGPLRSSNSERTASTTVRLKRQGLSVVKSSGFAVRSIRRGSDDWRELVKPFVSDLVFRSIVCRRNYSEVTFRPYTCTGAAVLFVDLSRYSQITAAIKGGAHSLSTIVNAYLERLLQIVHEHGGDVVKFAGDAVLIVWEGNELQENVWCAARCVMDLQKRAASHPVEGTDLAFQIHCGLCCGRLESEVFEAPTHLHMQRLYHSVGGETMEEIGILTDLAKAGEVCVSAGVADVIGPFGTFRNADLYYESKILVDLNLDDAAVEATEQHVMTSLSERLLRRNRFIEEDFIHPSVLRQLSHGGLSPTQIAQMRNLCVLFIAMTSHGSSVNWLMEVQGVLDKNRCPIVQIIDDDKGVHLVAAVNLYEAIPETSIVGLRICEELTEKSVGCAIGIAMGSTFCGVTGFAKIACRWDITGPPAVRAARLMQYAIRNGIEVAVDGSLYDDVAATRMELIDEAVSLKGSSKPCPVYGLSATKEYAAFRVLETVFGNIYDDLVSQVESTIKATSRSAVLVTGPSLTGKKIICQRAAGWAGMVPYLHVTAEHRGFLQIARTIATWFKYVDDRHIETMALEVLDHLDKGHWSRAHDDCVRLVNESIERGHQSCFLVDRVHFLDEFSFSLIRECLLGKASRLLRHSSGSFNSSISNLNISTDEDGGIAFLCVHVPLYNYMSATDLVDHMTRSHRAINVPVLTVGQLAEDSLKKFMYAVDEMTPSDRYIKVAILTSGGCLGYMFERYPALRDKSSSFWSQGKVGLIEFNDNMSVDIPRGYLRYHKEITVFDTAGENAMRFTQIYDELPPLIQTFCKVLAIATRNGFYRLPKVQCWEAINDIFADGVGLEELEEIIVETRDMHLVKVEFENDKELLSFLCPAMCDIVSDSCTPIQVKSIASALIERLGPLIDSKFKVPMVLAHLHSLVGEFDEEQKRLWNLGYEGFLRECEKEDWDPKEQSMFKEWLEDEVIAVGLEPCQVFGKNLDYVCQRMERMAVRFPLLQGYHAPIAFGPHAITIAIINRNVFHEQGVFSELMKNPGAIYEALNSSTARYMKEVFTIESLLARFDLSAPAHQLEAERESIEFLRKPCATRADIAPKGDMILDRILPDYVDSRLERLRQLVTKIRGTDMPWMDADPALKKAYERLQNPDKQRCETAQDALMTLATMKWKPRPPPEKLANFYFQSVARLRNKVLKRLSPAALVAFRHQQDVDDLEAFLVVTCYLYAHEAAEHD